MLHDFAFSVWRACPAYPELFMLLCGAVYTAKAPLFSLVNAGESQASS